jgi:hypothetical protein
VRGLVLTTAIVAGAFVVALGASAVGLLALESTVTSGADIIPLVLLWVGGVVLVVAAVAVVGITWVSRRPGRSAAGGIWAALNQRYGGSVRFAGYQPVGLADGRYRGLPLEIVRSDPAPGDPLVLVRLEGGGRVGTDWELVAEAGRLQVRSADADWAGRLAGAGLTRVWAAFGARLRRLTYSADGAVLTYEGPMPGAVDQFEELLSTMAQTLTAVAYTAGRPVD